MTEVAKPAASPTTVSAPANVASGQIIGNKNSKKYHLPNCPSYNSVSEKNRVLFKSEAEAQAADYTKAGNCPK